MRTASAIRGLAGGGSATLVEVLAVCVSASASFSAAMAARRTSISIGVGSSGLGETGPLGIVHPAARRASMRWRSWQSRACPRQRGHRRKAYSDLGGRSLLHLRLLHLRYIEISASEGTCQARVWGWKM